MAVAAGAKLANKSLLCLLLFGSRRTCAPPGSNSFNFIGTMAKHAIKSFCRETIIEKIATATSYWLVVAVVRKYSALHQPYVIIAKVVLVGGCKCSSK